MSHCGERRLQNHGRHGDGVMRHCGSWSAVFSHDQAVACTHNRLSVLVPMLRESRFILMRGLPGGLTCRRSQAQGKHAPWRQMRCSHSEHRSRQQLPAQVRLRCGRGTCRHKRRRYTHHCWSRLGHDPCSFFLFLNSFCFRNAANQAEILVQRRELKWLILNK